VGFNPHGVSVVSPFVAHKKRKKAARAATTLLDLATNRRYETTYFRNQCLGGRGLDGQNLRSALHAAFVGQEK
jgi:hypothetical protein